MCARCRAWRSWYWVRRRITLTRCSTNSRSRSFSGSVLGRPSTRASMITLKVSCSGEYSKSWLTTTLGSSPFLTVTAIRTGCLRSLKSSMLETPVIRPPLTSSASFLSSTSLVSW